jgi:hypothetical protein
MSGLTETSPDRFFFPRETREAVCKVVVDFHVDDWR